jgi:hypothetical protein
VTLAAFYHEVAVLYREETYRLVLDFAALDAIESETGRSFDGILREFTTPHAEPATTLQAKVVWGLLRRHHPEITIDQVVSLLFSVASAAIGIGMGKLFETAFPRADPSQKKAKPANPRKPRGASKPTTSPGAPKI